MARETAPATGQEDRQKSKRLGSLGSLWPFMAPYRRLLTLAILALVLTACVSLVLPLAVRRVVDNFEDGSGALLNQYFGAALAIASLLAVGTALRYALVTRLGRACRRGYPQGGVRPGDRSVAGLLRKDHDRRGAEPDHHGHDADPVA